MRVAIVNIGTIVSGDLNEPLVKGDTIITDGDRIVTVGVAPARGRRSLRRRDRRRSAPPPFRA